MSKPTTVAELLSDESKWCKGYWAKLANGSSCTSPDDNACCFCLIGATNFVYSDWDAREAALERLYEAAGRAAGGMSAMAFNDHPDTTFEMVRRVIEEAGV